MRILVVEDEKILGDSIVAILEHSFAAEIDLAREGYEAKALAESNRYDLAVLDWWIPPPTGIELLTMWRAENRIRRVLMLTGSTSDSDRSAAIAAGADDLLEKPFSLEALRERVQSLLEAGDPGCQA